MKNYPECAPNNVIASVANASGIGVLETALGMASMMGGIAGPEASYSGPIGENIHPGFNLIVAGGDSPGWNRAQDILLEPMRACQQMFRDLSHSASRERLEQLQHHQRRAHGETDQIVDACKSRRSDDLYNITRTPPADRHFTALHHPSFLLESPGPDEFSKAMDDVLDHSALIVYRDGQLFTEVLRKRPAKKWSALATKIASVAIGTDQVFRPVESNGPGQIDAVTGSLFLTCSRSELREAIISENPAIQRLLRHSVLLDAPAASDSVGPLSTDQMFQGYMAYYEAVKSILSARRIAKGLQWKSKNNSDLPALHALELEIQRWVADLPDIFKPFFREAQTLPYRLHWSLACASGHYDSGDWILPFTCYVTKLTLERQAALLGELMGAAEQSEREQARLVMLRKLQLRPRIFRDLLRTYTVQRREVHGPVLNELLEEGLIRLGEGGLLELSPEGRRRVA